MKYLTSEQAGQCGQFIKLPCSIFDSNLSPLAKLLYAHLLNLSTLSSKNGLCDELGVYVFCTVQEAAKKLDCCRDKAIDFFHELEQEKLIYRHRRGVGRATQIYLIDPVEQVDSTPSTADSAESTESTPQVDLIDSSSRQNRPDQVDDVDPNYTNTNYTDLNQTESNQTASSPVLFSGEDTFLQTKVKCCMNYFQRLTAGESKEKLDEELQQQLAIIRSQ